jgi:prophage antirepressor-like protein
MTSIQVFNNPEFGIITTATINGKEHFAATECASALGYAKPHDAVSRHCPHSVKHGVGVETGKKADGTSAIQIVEKNFIPEGDLYRLIVHSTLPAAERFERWVFDEVLPTIRRTGKYVPSSTPIESLKTRLLLAEQKLQLFEEYNEDILYDFDQVATAMKIYRKPPFGASHLKKWLAEKKILCSAHYKNDKPIQRYIDLDWFRLVMHEWKRHGRRRAM